MSLKFNINRPKVGDAEIEKRQDFDNLVKQFKEQSIKKARGDESWWNNKKIRYSTVIAGITVVCTITYLSLFNNKTSQNKTNETLTTQKKTSPTTNQKDVKKPFVYKPSEKLKIKYTSYTVNNNKGGQFTHPTSSKIKIPKNTFVDKNGKDVIGDVTIEYREFHDVGDIIASGIPMKYDSAGTAYNLESAGMFDIKGFQNSEPVFIKPEKSVQIEFASVNNENRFNQYYLDTVAKNWQYLKKDKAITRSEKSSIQPQHALTNAKIETLKTQIENTIPKKIDSVKIVYHRKIEKLPVATEPLKPIKLNPNRPNFEIESDYKEYPELAVFDHVLFEVGKENKNYNPDFHAVTWNDLKISEGPQKGKNYMLTLIFRKRVEKLIVYPVLEESNYNKATFVYENKLETYQQLVDKRIANEKRLLAEMEAKQTAFIAEQKRKQQELETERAKLLANYNSIQQNNLASNFNAMSNQVKASRIFEVNRFGIFNSDCPHAVPNGKSIVPIFTSTEKNKIVFPDFLYLIDHDSKQVFVLDKSTNFRMSVNENSNYSLCLFNNTKLYLCSKTQFKQSIESDSNKFLLTPLVDRADNLVDFKKALEI